MEEKDQKIKILKKLIERGYINNALKILNEDVKLLDNIKLDNTEGIQIKINYLLLLKSLHNSGKINNSQFISYIKNFFSENNQKSIFEAILFLKELLDGCDNKIVTEMLINHVGGNNKYKSNFKNKSNLPNVKRDRITIIYEILKTIEKKESKKTNIMYSANLDWRTFNNYMDYLLENNFIEKNDNSYLITQKGRLLLNKINEVFELIYKNNK